MILGKGKIQFPSNLAYDRYAELANFPERFAIAMQLRGCGDRDIRIDGCCGAVLGKAFTDETIGGRFLEERGACLVCVLTLAFLIGPLIVAISMSFDARGYLAPFPTSPSLRWYAAFFANEAFISGL
jgi:hypothetical protein